MFRAIDRALATHEAPTTDETRSLRVFIVSVLLAIGLCVLGAFFNIAKRHADLFHEEMHTLARLEFSNIVAMRRWNASYGGVWVEKRPGVESNPYLAHPDALLADGRVFTKKNPATMTREFAAMLEKSDGYSFHITSQRPLNPLNAPDAQESAALSAFEHGEPERIWHETHDGRPVLRYMAPLLVEPSCLECHAAQGYAVDDVRGGISVSLDEQDFERRLRDELVTIAGLALTTTLVLLIAIAVFFRRLVSRLTRARMQLQTLATTDQLTGLANRRLVMDRFAEECERQARDMTGFSCILADVDFFKRVNDRFGHAAGDDVLARIAAELRKGVRPYDVVGRFGGEEFLVLVPSDDPTTARQVAERLCAGVRANVHFGNTHAREHATLSLGLAAFGPGDTVESMLHRADAALYRAKAKGRDRVEEG